MKQIYNFSAGPAMLPRSVMERVRSELTDWQHTGLSPMEMSHRGMEFSRIVEKTTADLRALLNIPPHYQVLFLQGGATLQFSLIPMNLLSPQQTASYAITGYWSRKAAQAAARLGHIHIAVDPVDSTEKSIPPLQTWKIDPRSAYLHYTPNETIDGVEFHWVPEISGNIPLVADMSSTLLSRPLDVNRFGLFYASAQKNLGPAGLTIVVIHKDLLDRAGRKTPALLNYQQLASSRSLGNTPPTFTWYVIGLVLEWLQEQGGLVTMGNINRHKAGKFYQAIDTSCLYHNSVCRQDRSWMNIPFTLKKPALNPLFLQQAAAEGLHYLQGHRAVGGMRASLYNGMPEEGVDALIAFMQAFENKYG